MTGHIIGFGMKSVNIHVHCQELTRIAGFYQVWIDFKGSTHLLSHSEPRINCDYANFPAVLRPLENPYIVLKDWITEYYPETKINSDITDLKEQWERQVERIWALQQFLGDEACESFFTENGLDYFSMVQMIDLHMTYWRPDIE